MREKCDRCDAVTSHQEELQAALLKAKEEIARLKSESSAYCAYCSFELPAGAKVSEIHEHTRSCEFHPLAEMRREVLKYDLRLTKERAKCERMEKALEAIVWSWENDAGRACYELARQALSGEAE